MAQFSATSRAKLATCHPSLQLLFNEVVQTFDCKILEGFRDKAAQDAAFAAGNSKLKWPEGKHNKAPSRAVDVAPFPVDWKDIERFIYFAGYVLGLASARGIQIRWGGDWDGKLDGNPAGALNDLVHFELVEQ